MTGSDTCCEPGFRDEDEIGKFGVYELLEVRELVFQAPGV